MAAAPAPASATSVPWGDDDAGLVVTGSAQIVPTNTVACLFASAAVSETGRTIYYTARRHGPSKVADFLQTLEDVPQFTPVSFSVTGTTHPPGDDFTVRLTVRPTGVWEVTHYHVPDPGQDKKSWHISFLMDRDPPDTILRLDLVARGSHTRLGGSEAKCRVCFTRDSLRVNGQALPATGWTCDLGRDEDWVTFALCYDTRRVRPLA